jgi:hypothetical protein
MAEARKARPRPSGWLMRRIPPVTGDRERWGGGLRRAELAAELHVRDDPVFTASLWACYQRGQVDFIGDFVVAPAPALGGGGQANEEGDGK